MNEGIKESMTASGASKLCGLFHPRVSLIIPVFNGANYLQQSLESAVAQTYNDLEIIVVDDGSTDAGATAAIARRYEPRIRYIRQANKGVASALNTGIGAATGEYFTWLSHDDLFLPHKTMAQVEFFKSLGKADALLFSDFFVIDSSGQITYEIKFDHSKFVQHPLLPVVSGAINGCTIFAPIRILREAGLFPEHLKFTQDYALWAAVMRSHEFFHIPESLVLYRVHPQQGSQHPGIAEEADALWIRIIDERTENERAQLSGSNKRFLNATAAFLRNMKYERALAHALAKAETASDDASVSVVMAIETMGQKELRTAESILRQTHRNLALILVNYGSKSDGGWLEALGQTDRPVRQITGDAHTRGAALNIGLQNAPGSYFAIAEPGHIWQRDKIERQLAAMQDEGKLISHTSYGLQPTEKKNGEIAKVASGTFSGIVYPAIIAKCPINTGTVVFHRTVAAGGLEFYGDNNLICDALAWIWAALRYEILGLPEILSIEEIDVQGPQPAGPKELHRTMAEILKRDSVHSKHPNEIAAFERQ